jgi:hypothetical protein
MVLLAVRCILPFASRLPATYLPTLPNTTSELESDTIIFDTAVNARSESTTMALVRSSETKTLKKRKLEDASFLHNETSRTDAIE